MCSVCYTSSAFVIIYSWTFVIYSDDIDGAVSHKINIRCLIANILEQVFIYLIFCMCKAELMSNLCKPR